MLLSKEVDVSISSSNKEYYFDKGYIIPTYINCNNKEVVKRGTKITVDIEDLSNGSHSMVDVMCDFCGRKYQMEYRTYIKYMEKYGSIACKDCAIIHIKQTFVNTYGVDNIRLIPEINEKIKATNLERYGYENPLESKKIQKKVQNTVREKYGYDYASSVPEIRCKMEQTFLQKYGFKTPIQNAQIRAKSRETMYNNGTITTSSQQRYLHNLYGGEINYLISQFYVDIYDVENNLCIEYDGGGHNLQVQTGRLTQDEFNNKELIREKIIKAQGNRLIRIISPTDKLPSSATLLQIKDDAIEYFNRTGHTWRNYYVEDGILKDAEGVMEYDYGDLWNGKVLAQQQLTA